ncbi:SDR family NAD(P)-dependent oxidoreductase [Nocardiopsis kunsanensis]|uniref:SDR family NAD(P)-dependent oxidoreductase n=1 Tax=Nocardiopsis kunsanensis TaxID=141693 RepID=UPI0018743664|nr:SDR family NAD(P)-dependent oxidoreductase [Nocardiopsis kunsanensis]
MRRVVENEVRRPVSPQEPLERYGFDSVMALNVVRALENDFGDLPPTLLFEHRTVDGLAAHLSAERPEVAARLARASGPEEVSPEPELPRVSAPSPVARSASGEEDIDVAIVGISGRFPSAPDLDAFWDNLRTGRDCVTEIPEERWNHDLYFDPDKGRPGKSYSKWGGFLDGVDAFDASFFHVSPREAERMDPQERLFLEESWHALEDAGYTRQRISGRDIGVYVGVMYSQYQLFQAEQTLLGNPLSLGSSYASIANRVSYTLDLRGPSMALDTMCSSSLTAVHLACEALRRGDTEAALAGGVNLTLHPAKYLDLSQGRYASSDGRCRSFGEGGDGYVPGEGVGAVVLRPLAEAEADGDRIHAVIRASALNHGGRTNGYTVPNPREQTRLIGETYRRAGVDPGQVGYVEAHGTGTALGDPIEMAALDRALGPLPPGAAPRAVGSVKSNIGHLEGAAGIAGLAKIVLQMRHRALVPSLHSDELNPAIDFGSGSLRVQRELSSWEPVSPGDGSAPSPRIAGLSSFGAGGANAHLVVQEYVDRPHPAEDHRGHHLFLLSARSQERLSVHAENLARHLERPEHEGTDEAGLLASVAHTLRNGRDAWDERLVLTSRDRGTLISDLRSVSRGQTPEGSLRGRVERGEDGAPVPPVGQERIGALTEAKDLRGLAEVWVAGADVDWAPVEEGSPRTVSLPGYPFLRERHWPETVSAPAAGDAPTHPLIGRDASTPQQCVLNTRLRGDHPLLRGHEVHRQRVLPAAALMEMARAAGARSGLGETPDLLDTVFETPVAVSAEGVHEVTVEVDRSDTEAAFTISGGEPGKEPATHVRGRLRRRSAPEEPPGTLDIEALGAACTDGVPPHDHYRRMEEGGLVHGPGFRVIGSLHTGDGEVVARLSGAHAREDGYLLPPELLDGAFQVLASLGTEGQDGNARIPFAVERMRVHGPLPTECRVHARSRDGAPAGGPSGVFDLTVTDTEGRAAVSVDGLVARPVPTVGDDTLVLEPRWEEQNGLASVLPARTSDVLLVFSDRQACAEALSGLHGTVVRVRAGQRFHEHTPYSYEIDPTAESHYTRLLEAVARTSGPVSAMVHDWSEALPESDENALGRSLDRGAHSLLALSRAIAGGMPSRPPRLVLTHPDDTSHAGLIGSSAAAMFAALAQEDPRTRFSTLGLPACPDGTPLWDGEAASAVTAELARTDRAGAEACLRDGRVRVRSLAEHRYARHATAAGASSAGLREEGVYLLTGGLGGIGRELALYLARHHRARLVLNGRSPLDGNGESFLSELASSGGEGLYVAADCSDGSGARELVAAAKQRYGRVDGVFHLAGTTRDALVARKKETEAREVLTPKIWGAHHLDLATRQEPLDFFALFSSASSVTGVAGQTDYAFANSFLNGFADRRETLREAGVRSGRTVSVAWPLWRSGGMDIGRALQERAEQERGWVPLPSVTAMEVLERSLAEGPSRIAVFHGHRERILRSLGGSGRSVPDTAAGSGGAGADSAPSTGVPRALTRFLTTALAGELKLPGGRLDPRERFEHLGVESVMAMNITRELEEVFGELPKTLFFEHSNTNALALYLVQNHPEAVTEAFGGPSRSPAPETGEGVVQERSRPAEAAAPQRRAVEDDPIAIVGLAGRYPMAENPGELWENLLRGRDCVSEVPSGRWDHSPFFAPRGEAPGTSYSKWGGFLRDVAAFDPLFFNISPREARRMDPQERLFLETAWHTLEDAGHTREGLAGRGVGVFVGVMYSQYQLYGADRRAQEQGFVPASLSAAVANRVSHVLDLQGPSLALDTMCSSSLTALHMACASIRLGDCDEAIAGGVNTILHPNRYLQLSQGRFASTDGRCRTFGEGGDGYVPGEGVGAVLLKPLSKALAEGDHVYAVVRGTAVNHGGRSNGFTVPTPAAQAEVVRAALERSGLGPERVGYVEAHGTGTSLGDPIEVDGLTRAFAASGAGGETHCAVGSVKSNIGHLESAAGIAGLTKVLLQMKHGTLVPSLHSEPENPNIRFADTPFSVQRATEPWHRPVKDGRELPRAAAVSSFGAGGANAHAVLEEYLPATDMNTRVAPGAVAELVPISARTPEGLRSIALDLAEAVGAPATAEPAPAVDPDAVCAVAARVLGVPDASVDAGDDLEDLGFDEVSRSALAEWAGNEYGVRPAPEELVACRTLAGFARWIAESAPHRSGTAPVTNGYRLQDIALTLQIGREPLAERAVFVVRDTAELAERLRRFGAGTDDPDTVLGSATGDTALMDGLLEGEEGRTFVESLHRRGDLERIARLWAAGADIGHALPLTGSGARRVSLPTYPFARERYWVPEWGEASPAPGVPVGDGGTEGAASAGSGGQRPGDKESAPVEATPEPLGETPSRFPESDPRTVRETVAGAMSEILEIPATEFDLDTPHADFGVDSVLAVEIVERLNEAFGTELRPTDFFNYTDIRSLSEHIIGERAAQPFSGSRYEPSPVRPEPSPAPDPETTAAGRDPVSSPGSGVQVAARSTDVAVIGMSGRFAHARNLEEFWDNLVAGRDSVAEIPSDRWDTERYWDPDRSEPGKTYSKWGSVLADAYEFDPAFFGMSPREARLMDPQQRLYMMEAWRALEDAGYSDRSVDGAEYHSFVGAAMGDYHHLLRENGVPTEGYTFTGTHPAILASRAAYHLNLRGPSTAVDTSCSSSLMAVHMACEAIREGRCETALAGGVAVLHTPELHVLASKAGMLSPNGRCRPFDDGADGFVPGEGVGVVVLKSLDAALRDGDHIRGVLSATGANQDGRTNGITAPSAPSQSALESDVYRRFGVDPEQIGYVECHGTGTRLGDPIEIEALTEAFSRFTDRKGFCAIGSVKSNLGHTLTAAGVAGLIKALLCIEHGSLVPSLHFEDTNRHIPFADGPFRVNTEARPWARPSGGSRTAAVSSFGFSGTNVHVVAREAPAARARVPEGTDRTYPVPVSAKTPEALRARLLDLSRWLETDGSRHEWRDIAFTLAVGRSHFDVREVFTADGPEELRRRIGLSASRQDRGGARVVEGAFSDTVRRYREGEDVDWSPVFAGQTCRRVPLPTYPFAREEYRAPGTEAEPPTEALRGRVPEPSDGTSRKYWIAADDPVVRDHVVDGSPLLPAAGHLSLVHRAWRDLAGDEPVTLTRCVWLRPVFVENGKEVEVLLRPRGAEESGELSFEVRTADSAGEPTVHSRGTVSAGTGHGERVDLSRIEETCDREVTGREHYDRFTRIGVLYGPRFRTVKGIALNRSQALASLVHEGPEEGLPAGVLDGAIQSVAALQPETPGQRPHVPFAMNGIRVLRPVPEKSFAHVHQASPGECALKIVDVDGNPCVVIDGLSYRELKPRVPTRLFRPHWRALGPVEDAGRTEGPVLIIAPGETYGLDRRLAELHRDADTHVVRPAPGDPAALEKAIAPLPGPERIYFLGGLDDGSAGPGGTDLHSLADLERAQESGVRSLFRAVKALLSRGSAELRPHLTVVTAGVHAIDGTRPGRPFAAGLSGLTKSLAKEYPDWRVACLDVCPDQLVRDPGTVAASVVDEPGHPLGNEVVLRRGHRWERVLVESRTEEPSGPALRQGGSYLVLGGAGGIGAELALHLARSFSARIALVGRRPQDADIEARIRAVTDAGGSAFYIQADASDDRSMREAVELARERHGVLHGVFHSALVLRDARVADLDEAAFEAALEPKVRGAVTLARALRGEELDFLAFFSSAQSFSGNAGQSNYAAGCAFKDAYAAALYESGVPVRIVNWGYWGEVGVVAKAAYRRRMRAVGVHSIDTAEGMRALETVLSGRTVQTLVLKAEDRVLDRFGVTTDRVGAPEPSAEPSAGSGWDPLAGRPLGPEPDGDRLAEAHSALDALGAALLMRSFRELGVFREPGEQRSARSLPAELGVVGEHARLVPALVDILCREGFLTRDGGLLTSVREMEGDPQEGLAALAADRPEVAAHTELLRACLTRYRDLLRGATDPTSVLFPGSSMELVENVYRGDPLADRLNTLAAHAVAAYARERSGPRRLRILEVGAGTGGTTEAVLAALEPHASDIEYVYTDLSAGFLRHGRRRFAQEHPFVAFSRLDIESDPADQGFEAGTFDIVLAANVLHATRDLDRTLAHVRRLLGENGRLILSETTAFSPFATLTFGLLEGWWRFDDDHLRIPGSPLATVRTWTRLLERQGFTRISAHAPARSSGREIGQKVLISDLASAGTAETVPARADDGAVGEEEPGGVETRDRDRVQDELARSIARTLGRADADIDPERPFTDYGVDSIILVELVETINRQLGIELRTTALFDHPTLGELAEFVCAEYGPDTPTDAVDDRDVPEELSYLERLAAGELTLDQTYERLERSGE